MVDPDAATVDARLYRVDQAVAAVMLLGAFAFGLPVIIPIWAILLGASGFVGPAGAPTLLLIERLLPEQSPARRATEALAPRRMAANSAAVVLAVASVVFFMGWTFFALVLGLVTAGFAAFDAATGQCGAYLIVTRVRHRHRDDA